MIVYFDTSALFPLIVEEAGTPVSSELFRDAVMVTSSTLALVEVAAAVATGRRMGRIRDEEHDDLQDIATTLVRELTLIDAHGDIIEEGVRLAASRDLRGYDAMHLATAKAIRARDVVFTSGDRRLLAAASAEGFTTVDTSGDPSPLS